MLKKNHNILLFLTPIFIFIVVHAFIGFNGYYGQDSYEYLRFTKSLYQYFVEGTPIQDFLMAIPVNYSVYGAFLSGLVGSSFALPLLSLLALLVATHYFCKMLLLVFPQYSDTIPIFALVFFVLSPTVLKASVLAMTDMTCLAFVLAGFYYGLHYWKAAEAKHLLVVVLCFATAFMVRYIVAPLLLIPTLVSIYYFFKYRHFKWLPLVALMVLLAFLPQLLIRQGDFFSFLGDKGISLWSVKHLFQSKFEADVAQAQYKSINLLFVLKNWWHPSYLLLGTPFLFFVRKIDFKEQAIKIGVLMVFLYAFYLGGISFQNNRYLLLSFPFILLLFFPAFNRLLALVKNSKIRPILWTGLCILQLGMFGYLLEKLIKFNQQEKRIAAQLNAQVDKASTIYTLGLEGPLRSYTPHQINSLWGAPIEHIDPSNTYLMFHEQMTRSLLLDASVWQNYDYLNQHHELNPIQSFDNGFVLYEVH